MYITATSPYILMLILLVRGLTLDGASDGIRFYLEPSAEKLKDQNVRTNIVTAKPLADLEGARDAPSSLPKFLHFHAVFGNKWSNSKLAPLLRDWRLLSGKFWIQPLKTPLQIHSIKFNTHTFLNNRIEAKQIDGLFFHRCFHKETFHENNHWWIEGGPDGHSPLSPDRKFSIFMQFSRQIDQIVC